MGGTEVIANYGERATIDWSRVAMAHRELSEIMRYHTGSGQPNSCEVAEILAELEQQRSTAGAGQPFKTGPELAAQVATTTMDRGTPDADGAGSPNSERVPVQSAPKITENPHSPDIDNEEVARQRRLDARRQRAVGGGPRWNFSGRSAAALVDSRFREHEAELDKRRRLAFRARGEYRAAPEDRVDC